MAAPHADALLNVTAHRPWPVPARPWIMQQSWHDLLFAHWPVAPETLRPHVPASLPIDLMDGEAWVGIVPFTVRNTRARGLPALPWAANFLEANVRTYVTLDGRPGVYFFSLDAASALAVLAARTLFRLRYHQAEMHAERAGGWTEYRSERRNGEAAELACRYRGSGLAATAVPGTLDHFLVERYCLYSTGRAGRVWRADIHHPPWALQPAAAEFTRNTLASAHGIVLPQTSPVLHYAAAQHVLIWPPEAVRR